MKSPGWYLGLRYMQGTGLIARIAEKLEAGRHGADFIFADRVLCKAVQWRDILADWWNSIAINGCLILWLPDCRSVELETGEARLTLDDVSHALDNYPDWQLHEADLIEGFIYVVWQKTGDTRQLSTPWRKQAQHVLIARTGAHGDALMASSILPWLQQQGWTISFITREAGYEILKSDPHIAETILLATGQVADEELPYYWQAWQKRFDRFVNLTHSVEGELLKQPWRGDYWWPDAQRRALCGQSYLQHLHKLADVPGPYRVKFYPTEEEINWAERKVKELAVAQVRSSSSPLEGEVRRGGERLGKISASSKIDEVNSNLMPPPLTPPSRGGEFHRSNCETAHNFTKLALWCLRGSAVHKWWPYGPQAICQLLAKTDLHFVLSGNADAEPLAQEIIAAVENYHGDRSRIHCLVGNNSIREIMTLAHYANVVIGPETGVMNAVSLQPVPKILLLSHSAPRNLSDDWIMTTALKPTASCYPCHRLHYDHEWCPQDEKTKAAACAASIITEQMVNAVMAAAKFKSASPWWLRAISSAA